MSHQPSTSSSSLSTPARPSTGDVKEFNFRFPLNQRKKYSVMQFNRNDNVDLSKWKQAKMERENNKIHYKTDLDDLPKFGAGSEFGRERKEEARQKKYGIIAQKYKEEDQPWILKQGAADGKTAKKYRGRKEGRINENSSYFILSQLADGTFEAYPVDSWYNFTAMQTYKTLNAEEAEEEFGRRDKTMNYFSVMVQKKLRDSKEEEEIEEQSSKSKGSDLTLMEDDYFLSSGEENEDSDDDGGGGGGKSKSKKKVKGKDKKTTKKRPKKKDVDSEAEEESDEGDFDGREFDYISEQSSDDDEMELAKTDIKGLDQELQQLEEEEDDEEESKEDNKETKEGDKLNESKESKGKDSDESSSDSSGSDSDIDEKNIQSAMLLQKKHGRKSNEKTPSKSGSGSHSRSQTPTVPDNSQTDTTLSDAAMKLENKDVSSKKRLNPTDSPATKRPRTESPVPGSSSSSNKTASGHVPLTEEEVKRYLMKRPMTTKDLLVKLNPKRTGLPKEQIETKLAEILGKLAPEKRKKDKKIYWFIREHSK
ncbi:general transcription factor IIF subunit 1-like [Lytechinus variegatus]|uniref:general transcription factor IIF subunit 1-like n=1 Tax=Lytechinus variegatus TaxID=7654 RepID=UPI001BB16A2F|nr:general transcription factor IIF subunit 1-like [Lytechinus variegatus]